MNLLELLTKEEKKACSQKNVKKGTILFQENDRCDYVCIVIRGTIQIVSYSQSGTEIIYNEIASGGMFGNNLLFSDDPYYRGNVLVKEDSEILLINRENMLKILQNNTEFLGNYLQIQANFSKKLNGTIKLLSLDSAEERFLYFLKQNKRITYKSITSLAASLYLSRETLSRLISKLVKKAKITKRGKTIILN